MNFKFKKGDILVPRIDRTFERLIYPKLTVEAFKDKNYVLRANPQKLINFSYLFIEKNYEKENKDAEYEERQKEEDDKVIKIRDESKRISELRRNKLTSRN